MQQLHDGRVPRRSARSGFSLLEILIALTLLVVGMVGYLQVIVGSVRTAESNREQTLALHAARQVLERLQTLPLDEVFASFNADPADDPAGAGTAPGAGFAVAGLDPRGGDADGLPGEIRFPVAAGALREDLVDPLVGTPRDLSGDGVIDALDHAGDYRVLPVLVRVSWRGAAGNARVELRTILGGL
jgi:prepilin-type N-terminal cleavage/methylation domain-containing protein